MFNLLNIDNDMNTFHERLADAMHRNHIKQVNIKDELKVSKGTVSNWVSGKTKPDDPTTFAKLARFLGVTTDWLATGEGEMKPKPSLDELKSIVQDMENTPTSLPKRTLSIVPVRGKAQMGDDGYWTEEDMPVGVGNGYLQVVNVSSLAYAIKAVGQSMFPAIRSGWYVVFDPEKELCSGEYVHVVLKNGKNMIKELISYANDMISLLSINGMERLEFEMEEVEVLTAFVEIQPPSRLIDDIPVIENNDIEV